MTTEPNERIGAAKIDRILVAEDDDAMRDPLVGWLRKAGYEVTACSSGRDPLNRLERSALSEELDEFDLVLSDIQMPQGSALEVLDECFGCDGDPSTILSRSWPSEIVGPARPRAGSRLPPDGGDPAAATASRKTRSSRSTSRS